MSFNKNMLSHLNAMICSPRKLLPVAISALLVTFVTMLLSAELSKHGGHVPRVGTATGTCTGGGSDIAPCQRRRRLVNGTRIKIFTAFLGVLGIGAKDTYFNNELDRLARLEVETQDPSIFPKELQNQPQIQKISKVYDAFFYGVKNLFHKEDVTETEIDEATARAKEIFEEEFNDGDQDESPSPDPDTCPDTKKAQAKAEAKAAYEDYIRHLSPDETIYDEDYATGVIRKDMFGERNFLMWGGTLGTGAAGVVRFGEDKALKKAFAIKIFKNTKARDREMANFAKLDAKRKESPDWQKKLRHVAKPFGKTTTPAGEPALVFPNYWGSWRQAREHIMNPPVPDNEKNFHIRRNIQIYNAQMSLALEGIHHVNMAHCDLKLGNTLATMFTANVRVTDLGNGVVVDGSPQKGWGTPNYQGPEDDNIYCTQARDVFGFGISALQLPFGAWDSKGNPKLRNIKLMFEKEAKKENPDVYENIVKPVIEEAKKEADFVDFMPTKWWFSFGTWIASLLAINPEERLKNFQAWRRHDFFKQENQDTTSMAGYDNFIERVEENELHPLVPYNTFNYEQYYGDFAERFDNTEDWTCNVEELTRKKTSPITERIKRDIAKKAEQYRKKDRKRRESQKRR